MFKLILPLLLISTLAQAEVKRPTNPLDLQSVTVMISDKAKESGGSGVIFRSGENNSLVLTNSHVCDGMETGGLVTTSVGEYPIERFKRSKVHDICLVQVVGNLKHQTVLAQEAPKFGSKLRISGHPFLLPAMVTEGHSSKNLEITLITGVEKCTQEEMEESPMFCFWFGGMPIIKSYNSMATSIMIAPGNSGSGVFDDNGRLVGLAFAGIGRGVSHGFVVPVEYLKLFVSEEINKLKWIEANGSTRLFDVSKKTNRPIEKIFTVSTLQKL